MGFWNALKKLFRFGAIKAESGLNKLLSVEAQLEIVKHDTLAAIDKQAENAKTLEKSKLQFDHDYEEAKKNLSRYKTNCEVLKNKLVAAGKDPNEDDDMKLAAATYIEQKKLMDEMDHQKEELEKMIGRVEKMLKHLKLNKNIVEMKSNMLKSKIQLYRNKAVIDETGMVDIDRTFGEIDGLVRDMQFEQQASQRVDDIVNGREESRLANDADVNDFINNL